jgi:hypothetical protein
MRGVASRYRPGGNRPRAPREQLVRRIVGHREISPRQLAR